MNDEMEGQQYIRFDAKVYSWLTGDYENPTEFIVPLFRVLSEDEEAQFRKHARENYEVGSEINETFHPVWVDEARKMNAEAVWSLGEPASWIDDSGPVDWDVLMEKVEEKKGRAQTNPPETAEGDESA